MSSPSPPPFPVSGSYLSAIRESARAAREAANIKITPGAIDRFLRSPAFTTSFAAVSATPAVALPLKFASYLDELNLISVLSLLNFASGYRIPLHEQTGRGAWDNIRALVFSLYIASSSDGDLLSANGMRNINETQVAQYLGVNVHVERPHETIPGVVVGTLGGPLHNLIKLITHTLNETGHILLDQGYPNMGTFVAKALDEGKRLKSTVNSSLDADLELVLERLIRAFPAFQDMSKGDHGQPIYCFKNALFLMHAINTRFGSILPPPFPLPATTHMPVFTDNMLPSMLVHLGVIDLSSSPALTELFPDANDQSRIAELLQATPTLDLTQRTPVAGPVATLAQSYSLRAAAIDACELLVKTAHCFPSSAVDSEGASLAWLKDVTLRKLDMWIWSVAKDISDYRVLKPFILTNTVFF